MAALFWSVVPFRGPRGNDRKSPPLHSLAVHANADAKVLAPLSPGRDRLRAKGRVIRVAKADPERVAPGRREEPGDGRHLCRGRRSVEFQQIARFAKYTHLLRVRCVGRDPNVRGRSASQHRNHGPHYNDDASLIPHDHISFTELRRSTSKGAPPRRRTGHCVEIRDSHTPDRSCWGPLSRFGRDS